MKSGRLNICRTCKNAEGRKNALLRAQKARAANESLVLTSPIWPEDTHMIDSNAPACVPPADDEAMEQYVVVQHGFHSNPVNVAKAEEMAMRMASKSPGKRFSVCRVVSVLTGKIEVERLNGI